MTSLLLKQLYSGQIRHKYRVICNQKDITIDYIPRFSSHVLLISDIFAVQIHKYWQLRNNYYRRNGEPGYVYKIIKYPNSVHMDVFYKMEFAPVGNYHRAPSMWILTIQQEYATKYCGFDSYKNKTSVCKLL